MKLKTLKDIKEEYIDEHKHNSYIIDGKTVFEQTNMQEGVTYETETFGKAMKKEAIKDIKELSKNIQPSLFGKNKEEGEFMEAHYNLAKIAYIKWKFNITEDDLK